MLTAVIIVFLVVALAVQLFVVIHWHNLYVSLVQKMDKLQTQLSNAEWREHKAMKQIDRLTLELQSQIQTTLAPQAEELAVWIKETEQELSKDES